ncbi:MAG: hypothetical protein HDT25_07460 [Ruminococcus sp.]|nr:hypothetical protein [Ruminococcus sp.]
MKKVFIPIIAAAVILAGCEKNPAEVTEASETAEAAAQVSETTEAAESTSVLTTSVTLETESEVSETAETEPPYIEDGKPPVVMAAEELYDTYPVKIIYPERQEVPDKVKTEVLQEDILNSDGLVISKFYAEYPVLFGCDDTVCEKINGEIHDYIYGALEDERKAVEEYNAKGWDLEYSRENGLPAERTVNMDGTTFDGFGYDVNGNIFTVYFADYSYGMVDLHGFEHPVPMMFDLRTGDKIIFSELVDNKNKMHEVFAATERRGELLHGTVPFGERSADEMQDIFALGLREDDVLFKDERIIAMDGCIGFILGPSESGSYADGVRFWRLPASEFVPYMNDEGKALFEGYVSAETTAPKVIEYKGKRWFDNVEWIPEIIDRKNLTDYDREFILMFEKAWNADYYLSQE